MNKIRYEIKNEIPDETTEKAMIAFLEKDINFSGALANLDKMRAAYREKGYMDEEIETWIEVSGSMQKYSNSYPIEYIIRASCYSCAKTPHTHNSMVDFTSNTLFLVKTERTKELNTLGQSVMDAYQEAKRKHQEKKKEELRVYESVVASIVSEGGFWYKGKRYIISEKPEEKEGQENEE